ncbi:MAG TPA: flavodoxin-dependent (E)-4-hydroxy-3-methylbut-2-enyl-diphosphate synthase [bacterium]|mgnify:CR=1 FL=1|nr:flavodoxin-dependent (E)-4-hydroxy-3-methylbut-2-enyl-diphosphate synthase [bacterium]HQL61657.1 flavodoxin-dependent (E)-4-hydroxy-3-methylbut-2-enyl-diphosphate synthase [bacterium]
MILTCKARRPTRSVCIRDVALGGQAPIRVQTMVKQPTTNAAKVLDEIRRTACVYPRDLGEREILVLKELNLWEDALRCGPFRCDITRVSVPDRDSVEPFGEIVAGSPLPVVADIHFHAPLALAAMEKGCHKLRINPGNIGDPGLIREIAQESIRRKIPIRVGVNAGSLQKDLLEQYGPHSAVALAESARRSLEILENEGCRDLVVSLKANSAKLTIEAYRRMAKQCVYPLHLGVTEAGFGRAAVINSWAGIGVLLREGIGDTLRISLTEDPALEVVTGGLLQEYLGLRGEPRSG